MRYASHDEHSSHASSDPPHAGCKRVKMADSDGEFVADLSDDEVDALRSTDQAGHGTRSTGRPRGGATAAQPRARWEDIQRSWDHVVEGADGSITGAVAGLLEAGKRKRLVLTEDDRPLSQSD